MSDKFEPKKLLSFVYLGWHYEHTIGKWYIGCKKLILSLVYLSSHYEDIQGK